MSLSKYFRQNGPWLLIALAIGILVGVVLAAGIGFSKSDAARFFGALIGAFIAVSGAVALHYLKEHEEDRKRVDQMRRLIISSLIYAEEAKKNRPNVEDFVASIDAFIDQVERTLRFATHYKFSCPRISDARHFLFDINTDMIKFDDERDTQDIPLDELEFSVELLGDYASYSRNALAALEGKPEELVG